MAKDLVAHLGPSTTSFLHGCAQDVVARPGNEEESGQEAIAGQFMDALQNARAGCIAAEKWDWQEAPDTIRQLQAILTGAQSKTQPRRPRITGESSITAQSINLERLVKLTKDNMHGTHRQLVMAGGCGGWCTGTRSMSRITTACVIEWISEICKTLAANVDAPVLQSDLKDVEGTATRAAPFGPFDSAEVSSPCTDFSPSGKGIEGERAWVTVTSTLIALRLEIPLIFYENVPRMLTSKAWAMTASILEEAGYIWRAVIVDAADCGVPQNRRRVFVAATKDEDGANAKLKRWQMTLVNLRVEPSAARLTVADVAPRAGPFFFFNARSSKAPCILSTKMRSPTLRTNCGYTPRRMVEQVGSGWQAR